MDTIKNIMNAACQTIKAVNADLKEFSEAQENAQPKPAPATATAPTQPAVSQMSYTDMANAAIVTQNECLALARHIVKGMVDFPERFNIKPYQDAVAVPIGKIGNCRFAVRFDKKDASKEFTTALFFNQLRQELSDRMERVRTIAMQEIDKCKTTYNNSLTCLQVKYCDPRSPYYGNAYGYLNDLNALLENLNYATADNYTFLNQFVFYSLKDLGYYVEISFMAGYNNGAVLC